MCRLKVNALSDCITSICCGLVVNFLYTSNNDTIQSTRLFASTVEGKGQYIMLAWTKSDE